MTWRHLLDSERRPTVEDVERVISRLDGAGHDTARVAGYLRAWVGAAEPGDDDNDAETDSEGADEDLITIGAFFETAKAARDTKAEAADGRRKRLSALKQGSAATRR